MSCATCGILTRGDEPPANRLMTIYTGSTSMPNCAMVGASVAIMMPNDATANKNTANPTAYSSSEPFSGTPMDRWTTNHSDSMAEIIMTTPLAKILLIINSGAVTGITSKCSIVPRSRSRITAAPASSISSRNAIVPICDVGMNHELSVFGLNSACTTGLTTSGNSIPTKSLISRLAIWLM